jgi:hypothetical protein
MSRFRCMHIWAPLASAAPLDQAALVKPRKCPLSPYRHDWCLVSVRKLMKELIMPLSSGPTSRHGRANLTGGFQFSRFTSLTPPFIQLPLLTIPTTSTLPHTYFRQDGFHRLRFRDRPPRLVPARRRAHHATRRLHTPLPVELDTSRPHTIAQTQ